MCLASRVLLSCGWQALGSDCIALGCSDAAGLLLQLLAWPQSWPAAASTNPTADPKLMGPDALQRHLAGEKLPAAQMRTPLVELPLGATGACCCRLAWTLSSAAENGALQLRRWALCLADQWCAAMACSLIGCHVLPARRGPHLRHH